MSELSYPSEAFPALPSIRISIPDTWEGMALPGTLIAAAAPEVLGEFRPNVVVAVTRFAAGYSLDVAEEAVVDKFASLEDAEQIGRDRSEINGVEWAHIESAFTDPRVGTLVQAAHLAVITRGEVADLIQITGSVSATQAKGEALTAVRDIQRSARVEH